MLYAPEAQGSLPRGPTHGLYVEPVPASGVLSHTTNRRGYPYPYPSPLPGGQAGGWTNPNPDGKLVKEDDPPGLRKNMVYNPVRYG